MAKGTPSKITTFANLAVDFNAPAKIPIGGNGLPIDWRIEPGDQLKSCVNGLWIFKENELKPFLSDKQGFGKSIPGTELKNYLEGHPLAGAQLLDYFLKNKAAVPRWCIGKRTIFWTIYRDKRNDQYIRYLFYDREWTWGSYLLEKKLDRNDQTIIIVPETPVAPD